MVSASSPAPLRRGIASLEFVLVFPLLLALVAFLFAIAKAGVVKLQTVSQARQQTWAKRAQAKAKAPLDWLSHDPMAFKIDSMPQQPLNLGPVFSGEPHSARSTNTLIANPWAYEAVPFPSLDLNVYPHTSVLDDLPGANQLPLNEFLNVSFKLIAYACPSDPLVLKIGPLISIANDALVVAGTGVAGVPYYGWKLMAASLGCDLGF